MNLNEGEEFFLNPSGGGGGGGGQDVNVTSTTTNPVVPDRMKALDNALTSISTALTGAPVNLGALPGLDAPKRGPLIPPPSMGNMFASSPFQMGAGGMNAMGGAGRRPSSIPQRSNPATRPTSAPRSIGDLFSGGMFKPKMVS